MKCGNYTVSVVKRNEVIEEFTNIKVIMVYAETIDRETCLDLSTQAGKFVGKGKYMYPSIYLSNYTSISFIIHPSSFIHSFIYPSLFHLFVHLSIHPSIHLCMDIAINVGILYIGEEMAMFLQQVIPEEV